MKEKLRQRQRGAFASRIERKSLHKACGALRLGENQERPFVELNLARAA
jgi:hypothetical protein